jgi:prepilin-type N-terminal cleavage/methylation domain-containing protein
MRTRKQQHTPGFTLVELLVVLALMAILASLAITFFPNPFNSAREARAATQLQSWLTIAKQRALRDQAPRGLRLLRNPANPLIVTECQYIEQPDDFNVGTIQTAVPKGTPTVPYNTLVFSFGTGSDLQNGNLPAQPADQPALQPYWSVQPGDYLEIFGTGLIHQITAVGLWDLSVNPPVYYQDYITVDPPLAYPLNLGWPAGTNNYRIQRAPRPVGNETLKFPEGTMLDLGTNTKYGNPVPGGAVDILFAPNGTVLSRWAGNSNIHLWVRAPSEDPTLALDEFYGNPSIVSTFVRTGLVGAYYREQMIAVPVNPYALIR